MSNRISVYVGPRKEMISPTQIEQFDDGNWLADEKVDGCFGALETDEHGVVKYIASRTGQLFSADDAFGIVGYNLGVPNTWLVGELEVTTQAACMAAEKRGYRRFWVFDTPIVMGQEVKGLPIEQRRTLLEQIVNGLSSDMGRRVVAVRQTQSDFKKFYEESMERGHEGVVLKKRGSLYRSSTSDGRTDNWIRVKTVRTVDLLVIGKGKTPSRVDNLQLGYWIDGKAEYLQSLTCPKGYSVDQLIGKVIECLYDVQMRSGTYRHLRFVRVRTDKTREMCG